MNQWFLEGTSEAIHVGIGKSGKRSGGVQGKKRI